MVCFSQPSQETVISLFRILQEVFTAIIVTLSCTPLSCTLSIQLKLYTLKSVTSVLGKTSSLFKSHLRMEIISSLRLVTYTDFNRPSSPVLTLISPQWMSAAWVTEHLDRFFMWGWYSGWISLFQGLLVATFWTFLLSTKRGWEAGVWFTIPLPWWCEIWGLTPAFSCPSDVMSPYTAVFTVEPFLVCFTWESRRNYARL